MSDPSRASSSDFSSPTPKGYAKRLELGDMSTLGDGEKLPLINEDAAHRVYDSRPTSAWDFAGFGSRTKISDLAVNEEGFREEQEARKQHHLGQLLATSISGAKSCFCLLGALVFHRLPCATQA